MPSRIPRPCSVYPCGDLGTVRGKCPRHASEAARAYDAERNPRRARSLAVYRSRAWRRLRLRILRERPWCEAPGCDAEAKHVDHVVPIEDGGDPWDEANLQPLCHPCHSRKTAQDRARRHDR